jgi:hypothetical protein
MSVVLLPLSKANESQQRDLLKEVNNPDILKYLGHNKPWTLAYIEELEDDLTSYRNWIVIFDGRVSGYIGLRPYVVKSDSKSRDPMKIGLQIRIFTYPGGQGIGSKALTRLEEITKGILLFAIVRADNGPSNGLFKRWELIVSKPMYGTMSNIYRLNQMDEKKIGRNQYIVGVNKVMITTHKDKLGLKPELHFSQLEFNLYISIPYEASKNTYLFCGDSMTDIFHFHCMMRGWRRVTNQDAKHYPIITYIREEAGAHNYSKCIIKNKIDGLDPIVNKGKLPDLLGEHMAKSFALADVDDVANVGGVGIIKPVGNGAHSGKGICIVDNNKDLLKVKKEVLGKGDNKWNWIICQYIANPYLLVFPHQGLTKGLTKFHYRVYMLVSETMWDLLPHFEILTAGKPYVAKDWDNKEIHDSHGASTPQSLWVTSVETEVDPQHLPKIYDLAKDVFGVTNAKSYSESKMGYELLGLDVMFDTDNNLWLLEVNNRVGLFFVSDTLGLLMNHKIIEWEHNFAMRLLDSLK